MVIGFDNPELDRLGAAAFHLVETAFDGIPQDLLDSDAPPSGLDLYALLDRDANWGLTHRALDLLGTRLVDELGNMRLWPPTAYMSMVMIKLRVVVPAPAADELRVRLLFALEAMIQEVLEPGAASIAVVPVEDDGDVGATIQAFFPHDLDLARFAENFSTRDYFRWQIELGETPGIGAVRSEPCPVLGTKLPEPLANAIPPYLMISFTISDDLDPTVRSVVRDFKLRLNGATQPTSVVIGISVTLENTTPDSVEQEIAAWNRRGYELLNRDEEALIRPMTATTLMFEFPLGEGD